MKLFNTGFLRYSNQLGSPSHQQCHQNDGWQPKPTSRGECENDRSDAVCLHTGPSGKRIVMCVNRKVGNTSSLPRPPDGLPDAYQVRKAALGKSNPAWINVNLWEDETPEYYAEEVLHGDI
eukprot:scaffold62517_cov19-Prasinocladus_malaysianus.AAC.2